MDATSFSILLLTAVSSLNVVIFIPFSQGHGNLIVECTEGDTLIWMVTSEVCSWQTSLEHLTFLTTFKAQSGTFCLHHWTIFYHESQSVTWIGFSRQSWGGAETNEPGHDGTVASPTWAGKMSEQYGCTVDLCLTDVFVSTWHWPINPASLHQCLSAIFASEISETCFSEQVQVCVGFEHWIT